MSTPDLDPAAVVAFLRSTEDRYRREEAEAHGKDPEAWRRARFSAAACGEAARIIEETR